MPKKEVTIEYDEDANPIVEVNGAQGKECEDITRDLEEALGEVTDRSHKPEYKKSRARQGQTRKQGGG